MIELSDTALVITVTAGGVLVIAAVAIAWRARRGRRRSAADDDV